MSTLTCLPALSTKCLRLAISLLLGGLLVGLLFFSLQVVSAAPGVGSTIWLDGVSNTFMPVDVAVNSQTGYAYVVNQGAGNVWVISGTEHLAELGGGSRCPGATAYGSCFNSVNVHPITGKGYVSQWRVDRLNILSGTQWLGWVYGGQGPAGSVMHGSNDIVYALAHWTGRVTVIENDDDVAALSATMPNTGCINPVNGRAYIVDSGANAVLVIDDLTLYASVPVGRYPNGIACGPNGYVYVVNSSDATVSVISGTGVINTVAVGTGNTNLGVDNYWGINRGGSLKYVGLNEQTGLVYVANWGSKSVTVISGTARYADIAVGANPNALGVYTPTNLVYVANVGDNSVSVISGTQVIATIPVGKYPIALAVNQQNGYVYVVNRDGESISVIQGTALIGTLEERSRPVALAAHNGRIYTGNHNDTISVVEGDRVLATLPVGGKPAALVSDGNYLVAAIPQRNAVLAIDGTTPALTLTIPGGPSAMAVVTPSHRLYVANPLSDTVTVLHDLAVEAVVPVGDAPSALAADAATGDVFVANTSGNSVTVLNGAALVGTVNVGAGPSAAAFNPVNHYAYVANRAGNTVSVLNRNTLVASVPVNAAPVAVVVHPSTGYVYVAARDADRVNVLRDTTVVATIPVGDAPNAIAVDPALDFVYVTCESSNRIYVLSGTALLDLDFAVGSQPVNIVVSGPGDAYVANYGSTSLSRLKEIAPTVTGLSPDRVTAGHAVTLTVTGSGYYLTPTVRLNDTALENVKVANRTTLAAHVPGTLAPGVYTLSVQTADGLSAALSNSFVVMPPAPTITAISPTMFSNAVTTTVTLTGSGFISGATAYIGELPLRNVTWQSSNVITAEVPPGLAPGRYQTLFFDNMETVPYTWVADPNWQRTSSVYHSANKAWQGYGVLALDRSLDLRTLAQPQLSFWGLPSYTNYNDNHCFVEASVDGGATWSTVYDLKTWNGGFHPRVDLSAYASSPAIRIRFRSTNNLGQWWIDDLHVGDMADGLVVRSPGTYSAAGYLTAPFTVTHQIDHFGFEPIPEVQVTGQPFTVTITAYDEFGYVVTAYHGTAGLSSTAAISPSIVGPFVDGAWTGAVQIDSTQPGVVITATDVDDQQILGASSAFDMATLGTDIAPNVFSNGDANTVVITAANLVSAPSGAIGDLPLSDITFTGGNSFTATLPADVPPGRYQTLFYDNAEVDRGYWTYGAGVGLTSSASRSYQHAWHFRDPWCCLRVEFPLTLDRAIELAGIHDPTLSFWERRPSDEYWMAGLNHAQVQISTDGGDQWQPVYTASAPSTEWIQTVVDLSAYGSATVNLRFVFSTYHSSSEGWYVDDIHIGSTPDGLLITSDGIHHPTGYLTAPFTVTQHIAQFAIHPLEPSPQTTHRPFTVTIEAQDAGGYPVAEYAGTVALSATAPVSPTTAGPFVNGVWTGAFEIDAVQAGVVVTATDAVSPEIAGSITLDVSDWPPVVTAIDPITFANNQAATVQLTGEQMTSTPTAHIGDTPLDVTLTGANTLSVSVPPGLTPGVYQTAFFDNVELNTGYWHGDPVWQITTASAHSGQRAWATGQSCDGVLLLERAFDLASLPTPQLSFWDQRLHGEGRLWVDASRDSGANWNQLGEVPVSTTWQQSTFDLSVYSPYQSVVFRFRYVGCATHWSIDDIHIGSMPVGLLVNNPGPGTPTGYLTAPFTITCGGLTDVSFTYARPSNQAITAQGFISPTNPLPPVSYAWDLWHSRHLDGICYGPYRAGQSPDLGIHPTAAQIREDLEILKDLTDQIRLYGSRDIGTKAVPIAAQLGMSVTLGIWISSDTAANDLEIASGISLTQEYPGTVARVVVGNETLHFSRVSVQQLIDYMAEVRQQVQVPVCTAELWSDWDDFSELAEASDCLLVHVHPYWDGIAVSEAAAYVAQRYNELHALYPDKPIIIGETGWPSAGSSQGVAVPGLAQQQQFLDEFTAWAETNAVPYLFFSAFDEPWKNEPNDVGSHWGMFYTTRLPKAYIGETLPDAAATLDYTFPASGTYMVRLRASCPCNQLSYSTALTVYGPSVTNINIANIGGNQVRVTWDAVAGATGYEVWYAANAPYFMPGLLTCANPAPYNCTLRTETSFVHSVLGAPNYNYTYRVRAVNASGVSLPSEPPVGEFEFGLTPGNQ